MQFCGDDVGALVGDLGSRNFRFGYAGEDACKGSIHSFACPKEDMAENDAAGHGELKPNDPNDLYRRNNSIDVNMSEISNQTAPKGQRKCNGFLFENAPLDLLQDRNINWARRDGEICDWEAFEALWSYAIENVLGCESTEHPVLSGVATYESDASREKQTEIFFERFQVPALYLARNAMLSAFSVGRASALVVDAGAARTCVAPVSEGYVLRRGVRTSKIAGDFVDNHILRLLEYLDLSNPSLTQPTTDNEDCETKNRGYRPLKVRSQFKRFATLNSENLATGNPCNRVVVDTPVPDLKLKSNFITWQKLAIVEDLKASICRVWSELNFSKEAASVYAKESYELPDGTKVYLGSERFLSPELLINPEVDPAYFQTHGADDEFNISIPAAIGSSLESTHVGLRKELVQNIVLVGGNSLLKGISERLTNELTKTLPSALKPRFLVPGPPERLNSTFLGGSVLASLGSFQQLWVSRKEYEEYGPSAITKRCVQ